MAAVTLGFWAADLWERKKKTETASAIYNVLSSFMKDHNI